jgi:tetratricopeptide (TPR) repeat protein
MRAYARGERETVYGICRDAIARFKGQRGVEEFHWLDGLSREPDNREASIASYTRALEARPKFGLALYCRAMDTRALGRNPTVMADLDQVIQLCPGFSDALLTRASLNTFNKDHRAAVEDFDALIRDGKLAAAAHNGRGYARWKQGDLEGALADLTTAIRLEPDGHAQAYGFRAKIHLEKGDVDGAIRDASRGHQIGNAMFCKSVLVEALVAKKDPVAGLACLDRLGIFLDDPCRRPLREQIPP